MSLSFANPGDAMLSLWVLWAASWFAAAMWTRRTRARPGFDREFAYRATTTLGAVMFFVPRGDDAVRLWSIRDHTSLWALVAVEAAGFVFCWWARLHLGSFWSGAVTHKEGHRVVDTGPYAIVRHPIYTGIILALAATMIALGTLAALTGMAIMTLGFWMKARLEETFLAEELGPDAYDAYRRRVPMLVPFGPRSR